MNRVQIYISVLLALLLALSTGCGSSSTSVDNATDTSGSQDLNSPDITPRNDTADVVTDNSLPPADVGGVDLGQDQQLGNSDALNPETAQPIVDPDSFIFVDGHQVEQKIANPDPVIDSFVRQQLVKQDLVGLAIGIIDKDGLRYLKGYGYQDRELEIPVLAQKTMFRWASISKTLAGVIAAQLHSRTDFDLDQSIDGIYKSWTPPTSYVLPCVSGTTTVDNVTYSCQDGFFTLPLPGDAPSLSTRLLMGHLGGIMHYTNGVDSPVPTPDELGNQTINTGIEWAMSYLIGKPLVTIPGQKYSYSTFGINLAGVVLEQSSGKSFAQLVQEGISTPAGLKTLQPDYEWLDIPNRAVGYIRLAQIFFNDGSEDVSWKLPGGGFISTVEDMALFCGALMGNKLLSNAEKALAWTTQVTSSGKSTGYGLGFSIGKRAGHNYVGHSGEQQKARTQLRLYVDDELCIVVMSNTNHANTNSLILGLEDIVR